MTKTALRIEDALVKGGAVSGAAIALWITGNPAHLPLDVILGALVACLFYGFIGGAIGLALFHSTASLLERIRRR